MAERIEEMLGSLEPSGWVETAGVCVRDDTGEHGVVGVSVWVRVGTL
jgi:hypothetical protein